MSEVEKLKEEIARLTAANERLEQRAIEAETFEEVRAAGEACSDGLLQAQAAEIERLHKFEQLDREAAEYVESVICMRTHFTGEPPYVGWKGLGLALTETLDHYAALTEKLERYRIGLEKIANMNGQTFPEVRMKQIARAALEEPKP